MRSGIGANNLKYGAAYAPNLDTVLDLAYDEEKIDVTYTPKGGGDPKTEKLSKLATAETGENLRYEQARAAIRNLPCRLPPAAAIAGVRSEVSEISGRFPLYAEWARA